jgi:Flp pilus assembly protein TadD
MLVSRIATLALLIGAAALVGARSEPGAATAAKARLLMNSGIAHERLGQPADALADFTQALASKALSPPDRVRAIFDRGVALDALGRTKNAIRDYSDAIRLDPRFAPALSNRANAYRRLGRLAEAKRDYLAALAAGNTAREYPYYGLGQIAEKLGDFDTARDYYSKALVANPAYALAAQSLTALNQSQRAALALRPPPAKPVAVAKPVAAKPAPTSHVAARATSVEPASFVHLPSQKQPPPPVPRLQPERVAARDIAAPPLRQTILEGGAKPPPGPPVAQVQLGAFRDQAMAAQSWDKIAAASDGALQGKSPVIVPVDLPGKGRLWRLRAAVGDKPGARKLCAALLAKGLACIVVRD